MGLFDFLFGRRSMTSDYAGRHGEFDRNDKELDILEDMVSMDVCNPDADLEEHYGWENVVSYESEGFDSYADELRDDDDSYSSDSYGYDDSSSDYDSGSDYGDSDW